MLGGKPTRSPREKSPGLVPENPALARAREKAKAKDGKGKDKGKDGGKNAENQNPVTPRSVKTTELSSPDFKKPMVTDPKSEVADGKDEKPYSPMKEEGEKIPMPASSGAQAQVLMALLKDVADGKSSAEEALMMAAKSTNESTAVSTPTTESKDVHKVGRQLAKAQAKTKKAYETLKKMKEDWATWMVGWVSIYIAHILSTYGIYYSDTGWLITT